MQRSLAVRLRAPRSITLSILLLSSPQIFAATCESLSTLKLPNTTITLAHTEQGDLSSLDNKTPGPPLKGLPPFCRIAGTISPVPDSVIGFEIWMPTSNWNNRFLEVGNAAFFGAPSIHFMGAAVRNGYATASPIPVTMAMPSTPATPWAILKRSSTSAMGPSMRRP